MSHLACHASAPKGMKCADCTMSGVPCPECYSVHWHRMYPDHYTHTDTFDYRLLIRVLLRLRDNTVSPLPRHLAVLLQIHNFSLEGIMNEHDMLALKHEENL